MKRANWADHLAGQLTTGSLKKQRGWRLLNITVLKLLRRKPSTFFHVAEGHFYSQKSSTDLIIWGVLSVQLVSSGKQVLWCRCKSFKTSLVFERSIAAKVFTKKHKLKDDFHGMCLEQRKAGVEPPT